MTLLGPAPGESLGPYKRRLLALLKTQVRGSLLDSSAFSIGHAHAVCSLHQTDRTSDIKINSFQILKQTGALLDCMNMAHGLVYGNRALFFQLRPPAIKISSIIIPLKWKQLIRSWCCEWKETVKTVPLTPVPTICMISRHLLLANDFGNGNSYADGSQEIFYQAWGKRKKPCVWLFQG